MSLQINNVSNVSLPYATSLLEVMKKVQPDLEEAGKILREGNQCVTEIDHAELNKYKGLFLDVRFEGEVNESFEKGFIEVVAQVIRVEVLARIIIDYASPCERISMIYDKGRYKKNNCNPCYKISSFNVYLIELPRVNGPLEESVLLQKGSESNCGRPEIDAVRKKQSNSLILDARRKYVIFHPHMEISIEYSEKQSGGRRDIWSVEYPEVEVFHHHCECVQPRWNICHLKEFALPAPRSPRFAYFFSASLKHAIYICHEVAIS